MSFKKPSGDYRSAKSGAAQPKSNYQSKSNNAPQSDKIRITGMFQGKYGYGVRVTAETLEKLQQVKEGGFIDLVVFDEDKNKEGYPPAALMFKP